MLHRSKSLKLPPYSTLEHLEGTGNFAVRKYYKFPFSFFYRKKLKMIKEFFDRKYYNILDYGCGSGVFLTELNRHAERVVGYEKDDPFNTAWRFDVVVLASVLEFVNIPFTLKQIKQVLRPGGIVVGASPMENWMTRLYFKIIKNEQVRHDHEYIKSCLLKEFSKVEFREWLGLYFSFKATV